ncbi:MAG: hypothetical protein ABSE46_20035 [Terracidiphilus sp.]|jgi:hypothetical protein
MIYRRSFLGIPLNRQVNRRWLVAGWWLAVALLFGLAAFMLDAHGGWPHSILFGYIFFFAFLAINSLGWFVWVPRPDAEKFSAGIRTLFDAALRAEMKKNPATDEREERRWDQSTRSAYGFLILGCLVFLAVHSFGWMPHTGVYRELLMWFVFFVILNLPNAVYLWTEPDMEGPNES